MDLRARLTDEHLLDLAGVHDPDRTAVRAMADGVLADPRAAADVQRLADEVILPFIGREPRSGDRPTFAEADAASDLGAGTLPLVALLATAVDVRDSLTARGVPDAVAERTLHDLGQQIFKHRQVHGMTGLHNQNWLLTIWSGLFVWVGRLQYELATSDLGDPAGGQRRVLSVHIPETGPLRPADVDASLADAARLVEAHFGDLGRPAAFICNSWLLDRQLLDLVPGSNLASFCERWRVWDCRIVDRDGAYFGFGVDPGTESGIPADLDALPTDNRLHRALVEHWRSGGHVRQCSGLIDWPSGS